MGNNLLRGKRGIIFGALNDQSIAWKTAEHAAAEGARFTFTNTGRECVSGQSMNLLEKYNTIVIPADATKTEDIETLVS